MKLLSVIFAMIFLATSACAELPYLGNYVSFIWDPGSTAYDAGCNYQEENQVETLSLYLFNPHNTDFGSGEERAVTNVSGFECRVTATEGVNILAWHFPNQGLNLATRPGELMVGYTTPVPVTGERTILATVDVFFGNVTSFELPEDIMARCVNFANSSLSIDPVYFASIPGTIAFVDADDTGDPLVAGQFRPTLDQQFEIYQQQPVATDAPSWGSLKALYR